MLISMNVLNKYLCEVQFGFKENLSAYHGITLRKCTSCYNDATRNVTTHSLTDFYECLGSSRYRTPIICKPYT